MRTSSSSPAPLLRAVIAASLVAVAAGCGGGGSTIPNAGSNSICDTNAGSITLARPTPGYPMTSGNTVEIVASTNQDYLNQYTGQFDLLLNDNFGNQLVTNGLTAVPDPNGPHPYTYDYFYAGTTNNGNILGGRTYSVYLNAPNTNCTPGFVGTFST